jgi:dephospho-CoA kinase
MARLAENCSSPQQAARLFGPTLHVVAAWRQLVAKSTAFRQVARGQKGAMKIIGLLGGVASGKSLVARLLAELGAGVLDADQAGHQVLQLPHIMAAARQRWGEAIFGADGQIDRHKLARIVFAPGEQGDRERRFLEKLTHPEIGRLLLAQAQQYADNGKKAAVLDAALLLEAGWDKLCKILVFVDAPLESRHKRAFQRGWTTEEFIAREAAQLPIEQKRARADLVIDNSAAVEYTREQVERLWQSLGD